MMKYECSYVYEQTREFRSEWWLIWGNLCVTRNYSFLEKHCCLKLGELQNTITKAPLTKNNDSDSKLLQRSFLRNSCPQQKGYLKTVYERYKTMLTDLYKPTFTWLELNLSWYASQHLFHRCLTHVRTYHVVLEMSDKRYTRPQNNGIAKSQQMIDQPLICITWSPLQPVTCLRHSRVKNDEEIKRGKEIWQTSR